MADYEQVLTLALASLPNGGSRESDRQAVYERARNAQSTSLWAVNPPLPEADIARELRKLNEAIALVEARLTGGRGRSAEDATLQQTAGSEQPAPPTGQAGSVWTKIRTDPAFPVTIVKLALRDIKSSTKVGLHHTAKQKWFPIAFNDWYCPAVRRGYVGSMAVVFDIGVVLIDPNASIQGSGGHAPLLQWIKDRPFVSDLARRALSAEIRGAKSDDVRGLVGWTLVEPFLRCLSGVWNSAAIADLAERELPAIELWRNAYRVHKAAYENGAHEDIPADLVISDLRKFDAVTGFAPPSEQAIAVRLFSAQIGRLAPELAHKLDYELVDACLRSPMLGPREHEPPRRWPSDIATTLQSKQPGEIAGVTKVETKRPADPITDILPSELMLLREPEAYGRDRSDTGRSENGAGRGGSRTRAASAMSRIHTREEGLANLLYGRPLVFVHERQWDIIPKHRALVCYVVDAHQDLSARRSGLRLHHADRCPYRDEYVYAKRQVFDTLYDLAEAQASAQRTAEVQVQAAVFAIPPGRDTAVVHHFIPLEGLKRAETGLGGVDRLYEMVALAERFPRYFVRYVSEDVRSRGAASERASEALPADFILYLQKVIQSGRYRVIHLVLVGVRNASPLLERLFRRLHYHPLTPLRVAIIGVNLDENDSDARLVGIQEPAWSYLETASLQDALVLDAGRQESTLLAEVRARLVESIFGKEAGPSAAQLSRIEMAQ